MLRIRSAALARSRPSLFRAATGETCCCSPVLSAQNSRLPRRTATVASAQRRWLSQSGRRTNWEQQGGSKEENDAQRELQASFEQAHGVGDATSGSALPADVAPGSDSIADALGVLSPSDKPSEAGRRKKKKSRRTATTVVKDAEASPTPAPTEPEPEPDAKSSGRKKAKKTAKPSTAAGKKAAAKQPAEKPAAEKQAAKKRKAPKAEDPWEIHTVDAESLDLEPLPHPHPPVPGLSYNLDRCLFKPGVYPMQDARTRVFNFDPYLSTIMPIDEFDYTAIKGFVSSSNDPQLIAHAAQNNKKYSGSTSSMSSMLSHFHFLLSAWRPINPAQTSKGFEPDSTNFTAITRAPAATFLRWRNGIYAVDADKQFDTANVLSMLGKSLEKLLTLPKEEYEMYRRSKSDQLTDEQKNADESFHYTMMGDFILRSQLDAHDSRLPGEGMFDIKTRAVVAVRMDAKGYEKGKDYEIRSKFGQWESFEREYYDMCRSAFLKYSLQVRMGRMDGIFVAYHNTERMFGFQYFPLEELDHALHGTTTTHLGDMEFKLSLHLLNQLLNRATERFPNRPLRLHIETRPTNPPLLYFFAKPVTEENIEKAQAIPKAEVEKFERELMGLAEMQKAASEEADEDVSEDAEEDAKDAEGLSLSVAEMNQRAEEAVENDELGKEYVKRSIEKALERSGLLEGRSHDEVQADVEALLDALAGGASDAEDVPEGEEASGIAEEHHGEVTAEAESEQQGEEVEKAAPHEVSPNTAGHSGETGDQTVEGIQGGTFDESTAERQDGIEPTTPESQESIEAALEKDTKQTDAAEGQKRAEVTSEESAEQQDDVEEAPEEDSEEPDTTGQQGTINSSNLNDLIRRITNRTEGKELDEDSNKAGKFKQILSELLMEARKEQLDADESARKDLQEEEETPAGREESKAKPTQPPPDNGTFEAVEEDNSDLLGMILTVRNKVDGTYVTRPSFSSRPRQWTVEYSIQTMKDERAQKLYKQVKKRRRDIMADDAASRDGLWHKMFGAALPKLSEKGREFRRQEEKRGRERPVWVVGEEGGKKWDDVFGKK